MSDLNSNGYRLFIARHGETIFNLTGRIQGEHAHTPLTLSGFAQADEMGRALAIRLPQDQPLDLIASDTGRALQTLAIVAQHIGADWHQARHDARLREIDMGEWGGVYYRDLEDKLEVDQKEMLFVTVAPGGESYADVALRLKNWIADQTLERDTVLISHGMTSRVLRGLLCGLAPHARFGVPIAEGLPQGSMVEIRDGAETVIHRGGGGGEKA
ncbi:MAG: histidine phosphatase family protein [Pseudomonadota bacterium]